MLVMCTLEACICTEQNVGQLERRRDNCTQLKCACYGEQEEGQDWIM